MGGLNGPLVGRKVLVVDDETYVVMMLEDMLEELGCQVVGAAQNIAEGLALAASAEADVAVLDVNVGGEPVTPVAEALARRGIPLLFSTGYGAAGVPAAWRGRPVLSKPFAIEDLERLLTDVVQGG